ncbi:MAG: hypothetical protein ABFC96_07795 [Thermoguttaceae bacterium]
MDTCIYCQGSFDPFTGQGDHVIPAALGEFLDDAAFRGICPRCNSKAGACEQQLLDSAPEALFRAIVQPKSKRRRKREGVQMRGAMGVEAPVFSFQWDGWSFLGSLRDELGIEPVDQVVVRDSQGTDHNIRLFPNMRKEQLQKRLRELAVGEPKEIRCFCGNESEPKDYADLFKAVWPRHALWTDTEPSAAKPEVHRVPVSGEFRTNDAYFRALAKIAFHFYLAHSQRGNRGDEPTFARVRDFIMNGGNKDEFFRDPGGLFFDPFRPPSRAIGAIVPAKWCHLLAVNESGGLAVAYLRLFMGPRHLPKPVYVILGQIKSRVLVPRPAWAYAYTYEHVEGHPRSCGRVRPVRMTPLRRHGCV